MSAKEEVESLKRTERERQQLAKLTEELLPYVEELRESIHEAAFSQNEAHAEHARGQKTIHTY